MSQAGQGMCSFGDCPQEDREADKDLKTRTARGQIRRSRDFTADTTGTCVTGPANHHTDIVGLLTPTVWVRDAM